MKNCIPFALLSLLGSSVDSFQPVGRLSSKLSTSLQAHSQHYDVANPDRRVFVTGGLVAAASALLLPQPALADGVDYKAVAKDIMELVEKNPDWGPSEWNGCWQVVLQ
jgi:hypothetical protein